MARFGRMESRFRRKFRGQIPEAGSPLPQAASNCTSLKAVSDRRNAKSLTAEFAEKSRRARREKQLRALLVVLLCDLRGLSLRPVRLRALLVKGFAEQESPVRATV
jgi:hypothetical protein